MTTTSDSYDATAAVAAETVPFTAEDGTIHPRVLASATIATDVTVSGKLHVGIADIAGTLEQTDGIFLHDGNLYVDNGSYTLSGGTNNLWGVIGGTGCTITLNGGTMQFPGTSTANMSFITGFSALTIGANGGEIYLPSSSAQAGLAVPLVGTDSASVLKISGAGTFTLASGNSYAGTIKVTGGTLVVPLDSGLADSQLVADGGTVSFAPYPLSGDVTDAEVAAMVAALGSRTTLAVEVAAGDTATISTAMNLGTAGLTKTGDGLLRLTGANRWSGDTVIKAGAISARHAAEAQVGIPWTSMIDLAGGAFAPVLDDGEEYVGEENTNWKQSTGSYAFSAIENPVRLNFGNNATANYTPVSWKSLNFNTILANYPITFVRPLVSKGVTLRGGSTEATRAIFEAGIPTTSGNSLTEAAGFIEVAGKYYMPSNKNYLNHGATVILANSTEHDLNGLNVGHDSASGTALLRVAENAEVQVKEEFLVGQTAGGKAEVDIEAGAVLKTASGIATKIANNGEIVVRGAFKPFTTVTGSGTSMITLDGGTLSAELKTADGSWISGLSAFKVTENGGTIYVPDGRAVYLNTGSALDAVGKVTKTGGGALTVNSLAYNYGIDVNEGSIKAQSGTVASIGRTKSLGHRFEFTNSLADTVTGNVAAGTNGADSKHPVTLNESTVYLGGSGTYANGAHLSLPVPFFQNTKAATLEIWASFTWISSNKHFDLFSLGSKASDSFRLVIEQNAKPYIQINNSSDSDKKTSGSLVKVNADKSMYYFAVTLQENDDDTTTITVYEYNAGSLKGTATLNTTWKLSDLTQTYCRINGSVVDTNSKGSITVDEIREWNGAMTVDQVASSVAAGMEEPQDYDFTAAYWPAPNIKLAAGTQLTLASGATVAEPITMAAKSQLVAEGAFDLSGSVITLSEADLEANLKGEYRFWTILSAADTIDAANLPTFDPTLKTLHAQGALSEDGKSYTITYKRGCLVYLR